MQKNNLSAKRLLVIGGAKGIGRAVVLGAAAAGYAVAWSDLDDGAGKELSKILAGQNVPHFFQNADCTSAEATGELFAAMDKHFGGIDALVTCAGFTNPVKFCDIDFAAWQKVTAINLDSVYLALHEAIPRMKQQHSGAIVMVGSAAIVSGGGGRADYVTAKSALEGLSRAITKEFAPEGIRCNIVHPSLIETDLLRQRHPDAAKRQELGMEVPLRRLGQPEDIANAVLFLLSDLAGYITGQSLYVDGGRTNCK